MKQALLVPPELRRKVRRSILRGRALDSAEEARLALPMIEEARSRNRRARIVATALFVPMAAIDAWRIHAFDGLIETLAIAELGLIALYVLAVDPLVSRLLARAEHANRAAVEAAERPVR